MTARLRLAAALGAASLAASAPLLRAAPRSLDDFDHLMTGFPLTGAHERVPCESCHVNGVFEGTPGRCGDCHGGPGIRTAGGKLLNHLPTSSDCGDCHITASWSVARFDHAGVVGPCAACHNGSIAEGLSRNHILTSADCDTCHGTLAWTPVRFDHGGVTGSCFTCHNGSQATGKPRDHVPSSNTCEDCHTTRSWRTAGFDHGAVTAPCFSCHNGTTATGKSPGHIPSSNTCEDCHSTAAWTPAGFDHSTVTGPCAGCHDGSQATGKGASHFITSLDCGLCHRTSAWTPHTFRHSSPAYPGEHRGGLDCRDCHRGNSQSLAWPFGAYQPDCAGCHADDFKPDEHKKVDSPRILYSVGELRDCTGACHTYTDASFTTIEKVRSGKHRVADGGW